MKLATLRGPDGTAAVVIVPEGAVAVEPFADVGALLAAGQPGLDAAQRAVDGEPRPFRPADLACPVLAPGAIICVGLNFRSHILEMGREIPTAPTLFSKLPRALTDPNDDVLIPAVSDNVDYEGELAFVIGRVGRDIQAEDAWDHVAGLTIMNDVTMRDFQRRTVQWFAGKTFQGSTPVGPWVVTPEELGPLEKSELRVTVNGEERQRASLDDLVFGVPELVADISRIVELQPGDLIATGTPGGVGHAQGKALRPGDEVTVTIDGIGEIRNRFVAAGQS